MKHLFTSGEILYKENKKELEEGIFTAEYLEYDKIDENTVFTAIGTLKEKNVSAKFKIDKDSYEEISFKHSVKILMQSDIMLAKWKSYKIECV